MANNVVETVSADASGTRYEEMRREAVERDALERALDDRRTYLSPSKSDAVLEATDPRGYYVRKAQEGGRSFEDAEWAWEHVDSPEAKEAMMATALGMAVPAGGAASAGKASGVAQKGKSLLGKLFSSPGAPASVKKKVTAKLPVRKVLKTAGISGAHREANALVPGARASANRASSAVLENTNVTLADMGPEVYQSFYHPFETSAFGAYRAKLEQMRTAMRGAYDSRHPVLQTLFGMQGDPHVPGLVKGLAKHTEQAANFVVGTGVRGKDGSLWGVAPTVSNVLRLPGTAAKYLSGYPSDKLATGVIPVAHRYLTSPQAAMIYADAVLGGFTTRSLYRHATHAEDRENAELIARNGEEAAVKVADEREARHSGAVATTDVLVWLGGLKAARGHADEMAKAGASADQAAAYFNEHAAGLLSNRAMRDAARKMYKDFDWKREYPMHDYSLTAASSDPKSRQVVKDFDARYAGTDEADLGLFMGDIDRFLRKADLQKGAQNGR